MHRANWRFVGLLILVLLLAACGSANQYTGNSSAPTSTANRSNLPSDANPVLAGTAQATTIPSPTPTPVPTTPPVVSHPTAPPTSTNPPPGWSSAEGQLQQQLFQQINQDRAAQGLYSYTLNSTMSNGARQHDVTMSGSCGMQHQCPVEPDPCQRVSSEGISWTSCGENIGYTSPNPTAWAGVRQIDQEMLNEQPPDDGHRLNLLNSSYHRVGVGIYIDARGLIWMTEDFAS
ncbi:MAG: CAP domain-containing protein [Ktedonobacteraceae bacterium]